MFENNTRQCFAAVRNGYRTGARCQYTAQDGHLYCYLHLPAEVAKKALASKDRVEKTLRYQERVAQWYSVVNRD